MSTSQRPAAKQWRDKYKPFAESTIVGGLRRERELIVQKIRMAEKELDDLDKELTEVDEKIAGMVSR